MLTIFIFAAGFVNNNQAPSLAILVSALMVDIVMVFLYQFFFSFMVSSYFSNKRDYVINILSVKRDKKDDKNNTPPS